MIRRRRQSREIEFSFDSFLDVVANVVGIILRLILVAWVGARSYTAIVPSTAPPPALTQEDIAELPDPQDPLSAELEQQRRAMAQMQEHLLEQLKDWQKLRQDSTLTTEELSQMMTQVTDVEGQRKKLEDKSAKDRQSASAASLSLEEIRTRGQRVMAEIEALRKAPKQTKTLRYRTPVSHPLQSEELSFECRAGRVTFVDEDGFHHEVNQALRGQGGEVLRNSGRFSGVTQAIGAFRMRYELEMSALSSKIESSTEIEPITPDRGEAVEKALAAGSEFRRIVDNMEPKTTAITLWVYPDSFPLYRKLRDYLDERDFIVAGRPIPEGASIGSSSRYGTASRGQ